MIMEQIKQSMDYAISDGRKPNTVYLTRELYEQLLNETPPYFGHENGSDVRSIMGLRVVVDDAACGIWVG